VIILVISVIVPLITLKFAPHVFLFNPVWGWFPGPIYDEQVIFPIQLVYHGLFVITLSSLLVIVNRNIFKARFLYKMMCFLVITVILFAYLFNWSNIGFGYSLQTIKKNLGGVVESEHFV